MILSVPENPRAGRPFRIDGQLDVPAVFPSLRVHHRIKLDWEGRRRLLYRSAVETGFRRRHAETLFDAISPPRGVYRILQAAEITDFFSLFLFRCPGSGHESLTVQPEPEGETWRIPRPSRFSSLSTQKKESADEFYEARKYYPGDDPRRINWKLYAHSKELFIRVGEEGVPKLDRVCCLLLTGSPNCPLSMDETDRITSRFLYEVSLLQKNSEAEVLILAPGLEGYTPLVDPGHAARLLAGVRPGELPEVQDPVPDRGAWSIVAPTGMPELGGWLVRARERGIRPSILLWEKGRTPLTVKELVRGVFLKGPGKDPCQVKSKRHRRRPPLWAEGDKLSTAAGGGIHVRTK
jgi:hypothetical protein